MSEGRVVTPTAARTLGAPASEGSPGVLTGSGRPAPPERHESTSAPTRTSARGRVSWPGRGSVRTAASLFVSQPILLPF